MITNNKLLFDEFDIKDHAKTDVLKLGKKAFQSNTISSISLSAKGLKGVYKKGRSIKNVSIQKSNKTLIGTENGVVTQPFSVPLVALVHLVESV